VTRARKAGMLLYALCVLPILGATSVGDWPAVLLIGLAGSAHQAWSANLFTTVSDMFAKKDVGTIVGIGGMAGSIGGILFPWFSGWLLDRLPANQGYGILFAICASAYLIAFAINHLLAPHFTPLEENQQART
jgi:MFS transporter, ACS family, hexuronate transporter